MKISQENHSIYGLSLGPDFQNPALRSQCGIFYGSSIVKSWKITPLGSGGLLLIEPPVYQDERGEFFESWNERVFAGLGIPVRFVQDNQSLSLRRGTLRGIHFQTGEFAQAKLIRCTSGAIQDAAVDLRKTSPDYLRVFTVDLSAEDARMLYIPRGFGHGFLTLADHTIVQYKADAFYEPGSEGSIRWDDPTLGIDWKLPQGMTPILSQKDAAAPYLHG